MAKTQRRSSNRATGRKRTGGRAKHANRRRSSARRARSGAREARPSQSPRLVEVRSEPRRSGNGAAHGSAEVTPMWGTGVPGFARQAAGSAQSAAAEMARRAEDAGAELRRRREQAEREREQLRMDGERALPGLSAIGVEIALGALRLVRTIMTAPLRIALAFLRPREA